MKSEFVAMLYMKQTILTVFLLLSFSMYIYKTHRSLKRLIFSGNSIQEISYFNGTIFALIAILASWTSNSNLKPGNLMPLYPNVHQFMLQWTSEAERQIENQNRRRNNKTSELYRKLGSVDRSVAPGQRKNKFIIDHFHESVEMNNINSIIHSHGLLSVICRYTSPQVR